MTVPSQDMVLGSYFLTLEKPGEPGEGRAFRVTLRRRRWPMKTARFRLHARIKVRVFKKDDAGVERSGIIETTLGRLIFNRPIPQDLGFVDRSKKENFFVNEIEFVTTKDELSLIVDRCIKYHGNAVTCEVLDKLKEQGFKYSTKGAITISVYDMTIPPEKKTLLAEAERKVDVITDFFKKGMLFGR